MNDTKISDLLTKLDKTIDNLSRFSPNSLSLAGDDPASLITKDSEVNTLTQSELLLLHTKLHMFYSVGNGKGLKKKDIEELHRKVVTLLPSHEKFDRLDR